MLILNIPVVDSACQSIQCFSAGLAVVVDGNLWLLFSHPANFAKTSEAVSSFLEPLVTRPSFMGTI